MKRNPMRYGMMCLMIFIAMTVAGCSAAGLFFNDHTYVAREVWEVETPPADIVKTLGETGESMGLRVDFLEVKAPPADDLRSSWIMLSDNQMEGFGGVLNTLFLCRSHVWDLSFEAREGGKKVEASVMVAGKFGSGKEKAATKLLDDFRSNLSNKVGKVTVARNTPGS